jgi:hypothetical protein
MINRFLLVSGAACLTAAISVLPLAAAAPDGGAAQEPAMSGTWKLNVEASENPNGAERPAACARPGRGGGGGNQGFAGGGGGGGGSDFGGATLPGASGAAGGSLSPAETVRFCARLNLLYDAPPMMGVNATETDFMMLLNPETKYGFAHKTDNKRQQLETPGGPGEFRVKWDDEKIVREVETADSLEIKEEYELSPDGKQLIVTLEASSRMLRVPDAKIRRVYDRQQQGGGGQ